jgi:hypothetical protein
LLHCFLSIPDEYFAANIFLNHSGVVVSVFFISGEFESTFTCALILHQQSRPLDEAREGASWFIQRKWLEANIILKPQKLKQ